MPFKIDLGKITVYVGTASSIRSMMVRSRCGGLYVYENEMPKHGWNVIEMLNASMSADKTNIARGESINLTISGTLAVPAPFGLRTEITYSLSICKRGSPICSSKIGDIIVEQGSNTFNKTINITFNRDGVYDITGFVRGAVIGRPTGECGAWGL